MVSGDIHSIILSLFLLIHILNELLYPFHLEYNISPFLLITFSILFYFFFSFLFINRSNNFFSIKIISEICPWLNILNICNHKNFFRPIWRVNLFKKRLYFNFITMSLTFILGPLSLISLLESVCVLDFTLTGFILIAL